MMLMNRTTTTTAWEGNNMLIMKNTKRIKNQYVIVIRPHDEGFEEWEFLRDDRNGREFTDYRFSLPTWSWNPAECRLFKSKRHAENVLQMIAKFNNCRRAEVLDAATALR